MYAWLLSAAESNCTTCERISSSGKISGLFADSGSILTASSRTPFTDEMKPLPTAIIAAIFGS